ncbi:MAG: hypothetical protein OEZ02_02525 [Anaerolineae bacterium]|nr:hypothetical protein [Anaerolineae bacterium]
MRSKLLFFWQSTQASAAEILALLGGLLYLWQARFYAHAQLSLVDEGAYLYKGYLFVTGQYRPFQDYGPWTNHMPLSFIIPGAIQAWFGPGLRPARYFSVALALLALLGLWIIARRFAGRWWALAVVWAMVLNPTYARAYSTGVSQGLVIFMLVWILVLVLGEDRPIWQLTSGAALAGVLMMTRINLTPVLGFVILYVFWRHGRRAGLLAALAGLLPVIAIHALYWPDILKIWAGRFPRDLIPFLSQWRKPVDGAAAWNPSVVPQSRVFSLLVGLRAHFMGFAGFFAAALLWKPSKKWLDQGRFKDTVFIFSLFAVLLAFHAAASLGDSYCVFCFDSYLAFFSPLGILLLVFLAVERVDRLPLPPWRQILITALVITLSVGFSYSAWSDWRDLLLSFQSWQTQLVPSWPNLVALLPRLVGKIGLQINQLYQIVAAGIGLVIAALLTILAWMFQRRFHLNGKPYQFSPILVLLVMVFGLLLSPTQWLGGAGNFETCGSDVIASYEEVGAVLQQHVPSGSAVFWVGGDSPVPLLYIPGAEIYPPQLNASYSFYWGGDPDTQLKFGRWNGVLAVNWVQQADFILASPKAARHILPSNFIELGQYERTAVTPSVGECGLSAHILIYQAQR